MFFPKSQYTNKSKVVAAVPFAEKIQIVKGGWLVFFDIEDWYAWQKQGK